MAFTLVGYSESQDNASLATVQALSDPHVRTQGDDIIVPRGLANIIAVYAIGPNLTQAQLASPSLRRFVNLDIYPFERASTPQADNPRLYTLVDNPIRLDEDEALNALAAEDAVGAARETVLVWLADGEPSPASGNIFTVRATSTGTATAFAWTNVQLTFTQTLPAGRYAVVGSFHQSATAIAHRFVFVGGVWRPGALSSAAAGDAGHPYFRQGRLGVFGEFNHNTPPSVDVLCGAADASHQFYIDLIKVG